METKTTLIRSDSAVKLYTISLVYLNNALVIYPWNAEGNDSFRLYKTLQKGHAAVFFFIFVNYDLQGIQNFLYCLVKFRLTWILCYDSFVYFFSIRHYDFLLVHRHRRGSRRR